MQFQAPGEDRLSQSIGITLGAGASEEDTEGSGVVQKEEDPRASRGSGELFDGCQNREQLQSVDLSL